MTMLMVEIFNEDMHKLCGCVIMGFDCLMKEMRYQPSRQF